MKPVRTSANMLVPNTPHITPIQKSLTD